jgi:hypothetical protein
MTWVGYKYTIEGIRMYNHIITLVRPTTEIPFCFQKFSEQYTPIKEIMESSPGFIETNIGYTDDKLSYREIHSWDDPASTLAFVTSNKQMLEDYKNLTREYNILNKISAAVTSETV